MTYPKTKKGSAVSSLIRLTDFVKWDAALRDLFAQKALHAKDNMCNISITLSVESGAYSKCWSAHRLSLCLFLCVSLSHLCMIYTTADVVIVFQSVHNSFGVWVLFLTHPDRLPFSIQISATPTASEWWNNSRVWNQPQKWEVLVMIVNNKWLFTATEIIQLNHCQWNLLTAVNTLA